MRKKKIGKKKKLLYKQLGIDYKQPDKYFSIEEVRKRIPFYVIFRCKSNINLGEFMLFPNIDYVAQLSLFESIRRENYSIVEPSKIKFSELYRRYNGEVVNDSSILIWRYGGLGDLICLYPVIRYIKENCKNTKVIFKTASKNMSLFELFPDNVRPDEVGTIPFTANDMKSADYHLSFEGAIEKMAHKEGMNRVLSLLEFVGIKDWSTDISLRVPDRYLKKHFSNRDIYKNMIVIHGRASAPNRSLNLKCYLEIVKSLLDAGFKVGIMDMKSQAGDIDAFLSMFPGFVNKKLFNLANFCDTICDAAAVIYYSSFFIGIDSSPAHIAAGLEKPSIVLCGSFDGNIVYSYSKTTHCINVYKYWNECGICPCSHHFEEIFSCPFFKKEGYFGCMDVFRPEDIFNILSIYFD